VVMPRAFRVCSLTLPMPGTCLQEGGECGQKRVRQRVTTRLSLLDMHRMHNTCVVPVVRWQALLKPGKHCRSTTQGTHKCT
jgi:hypothetical protein